MVSLIKELINEISENGDILSILRKALVVSKRLNLNDFERWISFELGGYDLEKDLPEYRIIDCELVQDIAQGTIAMGSITRNVPVTQLPHEIEELARKLYLRYSISKIKSICATYDDEIRFNAPPVICELLNNPLVYRGCRSYQLENIIEQVKDELLNWCLDLEERGILGEDNEFTEVEKKNAKNVTLNILAYDSSIQIGNNTLEINNAFNQISNNLVAMKNILNENNIDESISLEISENIEIIEKQIAEKDPDISLIEKSTNAIKSISKGIISNGIYSIMCNHVNEILNILLFIKGLFLSGIN